MMRLNKEKRYTLDKKEKGLELEYNAIREEVVVL